LIKETTEAFDWVELTTKQDPLITQICVTLTNFKIVNLPYNRYYNGIY